MLYLITFWKDATMLEINLSQVDNGLRTCDEYRDATTASNLFYRLHLLIKQFSVRRICCI